MGKTENQILELLKSSSTPLTLVELAEKLEKKPKIIFKSLRKLFEKDKIICDNRVRKYEIKRDD
jgi:predicted transcriptional regulator